VQYLQHAGDVALYSLPHVTTCTGDAQNGCDVCRARSVVADVHHKYYLFNLISLFICQNVRSAIFRVNKNFTVQQTRQTGECTAFRPISAVKSRLRQSDGRAVKDDAVVEIIQELK